MSHELTMGVWKKERKWEILMVMGVEMEAFVPILS